MFVVAVVFLCLFLHVCVLLFFTCLFYLFAFVLVCLLYVLYFVICLDVIYIYNARKASGEGEAFSTKFLGVVPVPVSLSATGMHYPRLNEAACERGAGRKGGGRAPPPKKRSKNK